MAEKRCNKCDEVKPLEEFTSGRNACKACVSAYNRAYREANAQHLREKAAQHYEANKETIREQNRAYREANKEADRERSRRYYEANKDSLSEKNRRYHEANRDSMLEYKRRYYEANKDSLSEKNRRYYEANRAAAREYSRRYREENAEALREKKREYYEANKETILERLRSAEVRERSNARRRELGHPSSRRRRARMAAVPSDGWTNIEAASLWDEMGLYGCQACGAPEVHADHLYPINGGGHDEVWNIRPLCKSHNSSKRDQLNWRPA